MEREPRSTSTVDELSAAARSGRAVYETPSIRRLGSVRELTLSTGTIVNFDQISLGNRKAAP